MVKPVPYPEGLSQLPNSNETHHNTILLGWTHDIMNSIRGLRVVVVLQMLATHKLPLLQSLCCITIYWFWCWSHLLDWTVLGQRLLCFSCLFPKSCLKFLCWLNVGRPHKFFRIVPGKVVGGSGSSAVLMGNMATGGGHLDKQQWMCSVVEEWRILSLLQVENHYPNQPLLLIGARGCLICQMGV